MSNLMDYVWAAEFVRVRAKLLNEPYSHRTIAGHLSGDHYLAEVAREASVWADRAVRELRKIQDDLGEEMLAKVRSMMPKDPG